MRSDSHDSAPAPEPVGVRHRRTAGLHPAGAGRSKWAPAVLVSFGLLGVVGVNALPEPEPTPVTTIAEESPPASTAPDAPADATAPDASAPDTISEIGGGTGEAPAAEIVPVAPETPQDPSEAPVTPDAERGTPDQPDLSDGDVPVMPVIPQGGWPLRAIRFPVAGPVSYGNDWGACRDGCSRRHIGNDIIGHRLQPLLAATDGTITHFVENHPTAGWGLVITDADGWEYRYYHVNNDEPGSDNGRDDGTWRFPTGITLGASVKAGQAVAFMGDSGNSEQSVPHVHFEIHRPDGTPVNPYASLRSAELVDRCSNAGDPFRNALFPVPTRTSANIEVTTITGEGAILVGADGAYVPSGDGILVGDPDHVYDGFSCDQAGAIVSGALCSSEAAILATIRQMESGGDYQARAAQASASGAYQFVDSTWAGYGGYTSAWQAPPPVQDAKALEDVQRFLETYGDIAKIPVAWYWPRALTNPADMDIVPRPDAGNRLTVRQYQQRWLAEYAAHQAVEGSCPG